MPVVCTGFAVRADFHYEKFLVLLVIKGGQVIRAHPEALRNFPDRGLPLPHLPDRLRAEYDIYCLLDMDNSSGGRRWPTPAGTSLAWGVKHAGTNAERRYCMSQVNAKDRSANQRVVLA